MINKIIHFLIIILFFSIPLINSHLLDIFYLNNIWKYFYINWNYEFSKVLFFNILSGFIIFLFFFKNLLFPLPQGRELRWGQFIFLIISIILLSNIFSITPFTSLFWNSDKWHSSLMFLNLIWLFIVLINLIKNNEKLKNSILKTIIYSWFIVSLIWIKEFLFPTFDYWDLSNRALSTLWHPNYLALFLLLIIPIVNYKIKSCQQQGQVLWKYIYSTILFFIIISLFLTKSILAIFLFFNYLIYLKYEKIKEIIHLWISSFNTKRKKLQDIIFWIIYIFFIITSIFIILKLYPEKLSSFISRFYIWKTTLNIIFSNIKTFIFWNWLWNLDLIFELFKSKELYIFENFWFVADRPHNIFLNIFYSFWIIWIGLFWYLITKFYKLITLHTSNNSLEKWRNNKIYIEVLVLFLLFNIFNFSSIASYLIIIFIISIIYNVFIPFNKEDYREIFKLWISLFFITTSLFSIYFYSNYFIEEHKLYNNSNYQTNNFLLKKINSENKEKTIFENYSSDSKILCNKLILNSPSAENYIYCGNLLYYLDKKTSINYYNLWLEKLPDLWNNNSKYYKSIFINKTNLQHRFFSEKYWNLNKVLKRVWIKINF